jgi:hypothetical protein
LPLFIAIGAVAIPFALVATTQHSSGSLFSDYARLIGARSADPDVRGALQRAVADDQMSARGAFPIALLGMVLSLLATTTAYVYASAFDAGEPVALPAAFRTALGRWAAEIVLDLYGAIASAAALVACAIPLVVLAAVFLALKLAAAAAIVSVVVFTTLAIAFVIFQSLTVQIAAIDVAVTRRAPMAALAGAFRATLDRRSWRTTLGVTAALLVLVVLLVLAASAGVAAATALHVRAFGPLIAAPFNVIVAGLETSILVVFARELREERTGSDLEARARIESEPPAPLDRDGLSTTDRELIGQFLARRAQFDAGARPVVAAAIAMRVRPKLAASFAHLDDESLLEHLGRA